MAQGLRLLPVEVARAAGSWRWLAVPPVFFGAGWLGSENAAFNYAAQQPRQANLWDAPLIMMTNNSVLIFACTLGFVLVVGDLYVRDRSSGAAAMTLVRTRSRASWWAAKVGALGPAALAFSALAFLSALAAGAIRLPLAGGWSPAARIPWGNPAAIYPSFGYLPPPVFLLLVVAYTALALWAIGAVVLAVSTFYPHMVTPLAAGLAWTITGSSLVAPLYLRTGAGTLDPQFRLNYAIHFATDGGSMAMPWLISLAVGGASLLVATLGGVWRLRRTDW